MITQSSRRW